MKEQVIVTSQEEQDYVCKHLRYDELLNEEYHNFVGTCRFITLDICSYDKHPYHGYKTINFDEFKYRREPEIWQPKQGDKVLVSNNKSYWQKVNL